MWRIYVVALMVGSCSNQCYPEADYPNYTSYPVTVTGTTDKGVHLDDPDHQLDPKKVDQVIARVENCLSQFHITPLDGAESAAAQCYGIPTLEVRQCLVVKVAPDWHVSKCTQEEVFPCDVPFASCAEKGFTPTVGCPCSCRAMIQDNTVLIITPNMRLFPAYLTTLLTGCNSPWTTRLAQCSDPALAK